MEMVIQTYSIGLYVDLEHSSVSVCNGHDYTNLQSRVIC